MSISIVPEDSQIVVTHLAGIDITVEGRFVRQRCSWCGELLISTDVTILAVPVGQDNTFRSWEVGAWVEVTTGNPTCYMVVDPPAEDKFPDNSCIAKSLNGVDTEDST